ncbi:hypothetical protein F5146DRAFT_1006295 [Armillaria mellea]|nr:hypothetical protein F5146DRAFT_1006295 [Armillaria mellea]
MSDTGLYFVFFFGQIGPTTASVGFPLERFERETTLGRCTNGRKASPVCAFDEYLRGGEIMVLRGKMAADLELYSSHNRANFCHHNSIPTKTIDTVVGYLRRIDDAPKECSKLSRELHYLEIYLPPIKDLIDYSRDNNPWLATLQRSHHRFKKISAIVDRLKDKLLDAVLRWPSKRRWPFTKEDVADYLCRIARFKTFILGAMRHDNMVLLQVMQETLGPMNGHAERIAEDRYVTEHLPKVVAERITSGWIASQAADPDTIEFTTSRASGAQSTPTSKYPLVYGDFHPSRFS